MPSRWMSVLVAGGALTAGAVASLGAAGDQPPPHGGGAEPPRGGPDGPREPGPRRRLSNRFPDDPASAKAMLERWISDMEKRRSVFEEAVKRLDSGESLDEVRVFVREASPPLPWTLVAGLNRGGDDGAGAEEPRGPGRRGGAPEVATPEERAVILLLLAARDPGARDRLLELEQKDPTEAVRSLSESKGRLAWLFELRRTDKEMFEYRVKELEADFKARSVLRAIVAAERSGESSRASTASLMAELRSIVAVRQSARLALQTLELARIEDRVAKIRESIKDHAENHERILNEEVDSMLSRARESDWGVSRKEKGSKAHDGASPPSQGETP
ncbi:MAG: hypothetical protein KF745_10165 [Phycisphaeraceae bacterium]|nr:hypothetical protein [Phycisphaeraceae bacterium]